MVQTLVWWVGRREILEIFKINNAISKLPSVRFGSLEFPELMYRLTCHYHVLGLQNQESIRFHLRKIWLPTYFLTIRIRIKELPPKGEGHNELMAHEDEASLDPTSPVIGYTRLLHLRHSLNTS